jgi:8-oxo-dGTP diphosphatase
MTVTWISVAGRAVVRHGGRLLLVTDGASYWYTPGGRMEPGETLPECVAREVHEETGLDVVVGDVIAVSEFLDPDTGEHKVECYFCAELTDPPDRLSSWRDTGGPVQSFGFFDPDELAGITVRPTWLTSTPASTADRATRIYVAPDAPASSPDSGTGSARA